MREASEPQLVEHYPATADSQAEVQTTFLRIPAVSERYGVILSRPCWMWGAEMGVNEAGVVVAMTATFIKTRTRRKGLLGQDLLRLALERAATADDALAVLTELVERYGQGGPSGYRNASFHAGSSFVIADARTVWVVETAAHHWVALKLKPQEGLSTWALSNRLTLESTFDQYSSGLHDFAMRYAGWDGKGDFNFAKTFDQPSLYFWLQAGHRLVQSRRDLDGFGESMTNFAAVMMQNLRGSRQGAHTPRACRNSDLCLHAGGVRRAFQTTSSMVSELTPNQARHFFTGSSAPCMSVFQPADFEHGMVGLQSLGADIVDSFWVQYENVHRRMLFNRDQLDVLRTRIADAEASMFAALDAGDIPEAHEVTLRHLTQTMEWAQLLDVWHGLGPYGLYWYRLNHHDGVRLKYLPEISA